MVPVRLFHQHNDIEGFHHRTVVLPQFSGDHSNQTVRPPTKLTYERHILAPETIPVAGNCAVSCSGVTKTPTPSEDPFVAVFWAWKIPSAEIRKFFTGERMRTPIHVFCFKNRRNRCRISGRKTTLPW